MSPAAPVILPAIAAALGLSTGGASWIISLYALMLAVATAVYGRVADLAGICLPLVVGIGLMTASALLGALSSSYELLLPLGSCREPAPPPFRCSAWPSSAPATRAGSARPHSARWPAPPRP